MAFLADTLFVTSVLLLLCGGYTHDLAVFFCGSVALALAAAVELAVYALRLETPAQAAERLEREMAEEEAYGPDA